MKIIKSGSDYIQVDPQPCEPGYVWGKRWNWNERRWSSQCMLWRDGVEVSENELLSRIVD